MISIVENMFKYEKNSCDTWVYDLKYNKIIMSCLVKWGMVLMDRMLDLV